MIENEVQEIEEQDPDLKPVKTTWVRDEKGRQGWVFFDGRLYWLTRIDADTGQVYFTTMTQEEWTGRNKELAERARAK